LTHSERRSQYQWPSSSSPVVIEAQNPADRDAKGIADSMLTEPATRMDAIPGVKSALKAAGMTSREYLVFTWSVFQSGMAVLAVQQPGGKLPPCENGKRQPLSRA
jgi:hypothetical protein